MPRRLSRGCKAGAEDVRPPFRSAGPILARTSPRVRWKSQAGGVTKQGAQAVEKRVLADVSVKILWRL